MSQLMQFRLALVVGLEEAKADIAQHFLPPGERARLPQVARGREEGADEFGEMAEGFREASFYFVKRKNSFEQLLAARRAGIAEQESIEPGAPTVFAKLRESEGGPMGGVDSPADPGFLDPIADDLEVGLGQLETPLQRNRFENAHHVDRGEA